MSTTDELQTADEIGSQLVRLVRLLERVQAQYQAEHPDAVDRATYLLLVHLAKDGARRAGALAEAVHSDPSTVSRQVAHLVQLGLVERVADPADGRPPCSSPPTRAAGCSTRTGSCATAGSPR